MHIEEEEEACIGRIGTGIGLFAVGDGTGRDGTRNGNCGRKAACGAF